MAYTRKTHPLHDSLERAQVEMLKEDSQLVGSNSRLRQARREVDHVRALRNAASERVRILREKIDEDCGDG